MYTVESIKPAGNGWFEVRLTGPKGISIPMKQFKPTATEAEIFQAAFDRAHRLNVFHGFAKAKEKQELYRKAARNWTTIRMENSRR